MFSIFFSILVLSILTAVFAACVIVAVFAKTWLEKKDLLLQIRRNTRGNRLQITLKKKTVQRQNACSNRGPYLTFKIETIILGCPETSRSYLSETCLFFFSFFSLFPPPFPPFPYLR
jgi:hypothetical protein